MRRNDCWGWVNEKPTGGNPEVWVDMAERRWKLVLWWVGGEWRIRIQGIAPGDIQRTSLCLVVLNLWSSLACEGVCMNLNVEVEVGDEHATRLAGDGLHKKSI